jgi:hypothetical protein
VAGLIRKNNLPVHAGEPLKSGSLPPSLRASDASPSLLGDAQ